MVYDLNWSESQTFGTFFSEIGNATSYWELVLFFEFFLVLIIGSQLNKRTTGFTNAMVWLQVSSFVTLFSGGLLFLGGFVSMVTISILLVITILLFVLTEFIVDKNN